jgi:hypothetical protein
MLYENASMGVFKAGIIMLIVFKLDYKKGKSKEKPGGCPPGKNVCFDYFVAVPLTASVTP